MQTRFDAKQRLRAGSSCSRRAAAHRGPAAAHRRWPWRGTRYGPRQTPTEHFSPVFDFTTRARRRSTARRSGYWREWPNTPTICRTSCHCSGNWGATTPGPSSTPGTRLRTLMEAGSYACHGSTPRRCWDLSSAWYACARTRTRSSRPSRCCVRCWHGRWSDSWHRHPWQVSTGSSPVLANRTAPLRRRAHECSSFAH